MSAPRSDTAVQDALRGAAWIGPQEPTVPRPGERPAYLLRQSFTARQPQDGRTVLTATAHGVYEVFVNGQRVDEEELKPGFTSYRSRLRAQQWDVTDLLVEGTNVVGLILSDGWFRGRHGFERRADGYGTETGALLAIHDGAGTLVVSDEAWHWRTSWILAADLMDGQNEDRRRYDPSWCRPGSSDEGWSPVVTRPDPFGAGRIVAQDAPPVRRVETLAPGAVTRRDDGCVIVDFGQNINGWVRLASLGPCGTELTLTHGEHVDRTGHVSTEHLRAFQFATGERLPAGQVDRVTSGGIDGDVFEPRHTTHGFRYVEVTGLPRDVEPDVAAVVVHSDLSPAGDFRCDLPDLNRLHDVVRWSLRDNACSIPTDCPQRERSGFTGDWQVFVETASRMFDVEDFSRGWLRDLASDQWADGRVPTVIPNAAGSAASGNAFEDASAGSAGWGDAAVLVPWELWRRTGDLGVLAECLPSMRAWVDYAAASATGARHPDRVAARPTPRPYEPWLWDTGFHFGEWLEPGVEPHPDASVDHGIVATAFLHRSALLLSRAARLLGEEADAERYAGVASEALRAWRGEYVTASGTLRQESQANYVRALAFDLVPENLGHAFADRLAALVRDAGTTVGTGFLSTGQLLPALADNGHAELAVDLLLSHDEPSWLAMLDRGATTMWEWWDGVDDDGARGSLNHYSKGAVASFLHTHVAGLRLPAAPNRDESGGRLIVVDPILTSPRIAAAQAHLELPTGRAAVDWRRAGTEVTLDVEVPAQALVRWPDGTRTLLKAGSHRLRRNVAGS